LAKQKSINKKKSTGNSNAPGIYTSLSENRVKYDKQIDIPNPKLQPNKTFEYTLFNTPSNGNANPPSAMNNVFFPELEKLSRKLNKAFEKKGAKYLLKKQKELNDNTIQISIALLDESVYLTYTKPTLEKTSQK
jgi:DNA polymerase II small subunit/DNA polymerase delta subunit B